MHLIVLIIILFSSAHRKNTFMLPMKNRTNNFNPCANEWRVYCIVPYVSDFLD